MSEYEADVALLRAYQEALDRLTAYGQKTQRVRRAMRHRWGPPTLEAASELLLAYFYGPHAQITQLESRLEWRTVLTVRGKFVNAYVFHQNLPGTIGRNQPWFQAQYEAACAYHAAHGSEVRERKGL